MQRGCMRKCEISETQPAVRPPPCPQQGRGSQRGENTVSHCTHLTAGVAAFVSQHVLAAIAVTPTLRMNHLSRPPAALTCQLLLQSSGLGAFLCGIVSVSLRVHLYSLPGVRCQVWDPAASGVACFVTSRYCKRHQSRREGTRRAFKPTTRNRVIPLEPTSSGQPRVGSEICGFRLAADSRWWADREASSLLRTVEEMLTTARLLTTPNACAQSPHSVHSLRQSLAENHGVETVNLRRRAQASGSTLVHGVNLDVEARLARDAVRGLPPGLLDEHRKRRHLQGVHACSTLRPADLMHSRCRA